MDYSQRTIEELEEMLLDEEESRRESKERSYAIMHERNEKIKDRELTIKMRISSLKPGDCERFQRITAGSTGVTAAGAIANGDVTK